MTPPRAQWSGLADGRVAYSGGVPACWAGGEPVVSDRGQGVGMDHAQPPRRLLPLTSLRFFAAMLIVIHHAACFFGFKPLWKCPLDQAVSFFFVLSGFVITYVYYRPDGLKDVKKFLMARFARLYPTHFLCNVFLLVVVWGVFSLRRYDPLSPVVFLNFIFAHALFPLKALNFSLNGQSWAISAEMCFYLAFIVLVVNFHKRWPVTLALSAALTGVMIWLGWRYCVMSPGPLSREIAWSLGYINPAARLLEFVFGMSLVLAWRRLQGVKLNFWLATIAELCAVIAVVTAFVYFYDVFWVLKKALGGQESYLHGLLTRWFRHSGIFPLFGLAILVFAFQAGALSKLLSHKVFLTLGEASYSIFMYHVIIRFFFEKHITPTNGMALFYAYALLVVAISVFMTKKFEEPMRARIMRWHAKRAAARAAA
ncbi:acyltransferase family protein [Desulfarculus baarsii]